MFREMRRIKQLLSNEETIEILNSCTSGVLGVAGDDDYPYTVPVSYTYDDGKLYIHSAKQGHKIDGINKNDKVTFCVIDRDDVIQKTFTTHFRSVSIFGRARILTDEAERLQALRSLVEKYSPDFIEEGEEEIKKTWDRVCLIEIKIEHMTGKAAIEIIKSSN
ncbi:pyridoxamine 5'-phosphate oxidase family protein [Sedimentibacter hydroxybenzoicus DSM 7310]|uniref:Pyridoxamine 5'-phosphate oxidase family protein n=1 Tax=Sedimentibacter hydroxybenzoicus DSM 7310 TaxID=1123245 RepID=A0A974BIN5_SEDHY|nr:pyridoxamine 5'-phosphate oxidase family protein [Sedimentibacter hydroxybenzoicus]NYB73556.1 pyridoxamine 5'-phosphate oxidase family protein [Sedimentibacter hydroxybenzoicus DSM 7310]